MRSTWYIKRFQMCKNRLWIKCSSLSLVVKYSPSSAVEGAKTTLCCSICHWYCQVQPEQSSSTPVISPYSRGDSFTDVTHSFEGIR